MIKFNQFNVVNTANGEKAKVSYSLDNRIDGRNCVTLYAKDYCRTLGRVFADVAEYKNDTDYMTDYFDKGKVVLFQDNPLYPAARARAEANEAKWQVKAAARQAKWDAARAVADSV